MDPAFPKPQSKMKPFILCLIFFSLMSGLEVSGQGFSIKGKVTDKKKGDNIANASVSLKNTAIQTSTDSNGFYELKNVPAGHYILTVSSENYTSRSKSIELAADLELDIKLTGNTVTLNTVTVTSKAEKTLGMTRMRDVDGTAIYAGKKTEVVVLKDIVANTATNNSRQVYSKVAGLNIWENDGAGIQLGIGGRGLNPNRVTNFNTRQNGYDISADALGYPESYYTPPTEAVSQIEVIRGAASLQYGTQFGGLINFKLKRGNDTEKVQVISRETAGSWGFLNASNSIGGTVKNVNYYVFYQHKSGNGWRPNSGFNVNTVYGGLTIKASEKLSISVQYTLMDYLAQQPGGLTDAMFEADPRQSVRNRNWFKVNWNLASVSADYSINDHLKFNTRFFGLDASRSALGILTYINRADPGGLRDLWTDHYMNWGNESRFLYTYHTDKHPYSLVVGERFYHGFTDRRQGEGNSNSTGTKSDFSFTDPTDPAYSGYTFPNFNTAVFAENIFRINSKLSIIPGVRYENIITKADGFYSIVNRDLAGNIIYDQKVNENRSSGRSFVIGGVGASYYQNERMQFYANISQNYRAINFNDMRVVNPNLQVDPNLQDEKGYSSDLGARGEFSDVFYYDLSLFMINYDNRIGTILKTDTATYNIYRYRTNISQSRNLGVESFAEVDLWKLFAKKLAKMKLSVFSNLSFIDARYLNSKEPAYNNKKVELVPGVIFKTGIAFRKNRFSASFQYAYTGQQFTDATNAVFTSNAINGLVPAYSVMDLSADYTLNKTFSLSGSINNLTDSHYFTRRADSYPGPGIIPSDGRSFYLTLQIKL
jgi:Fe(3+) dicitrate transport protein